MGQAEWASFLGWCTVINFGMLMVWWLMLLLARDWVFKIHSKMFKITESQFNGVHYGGMGMLKLFTYVFNLVPYIVLHCIM